MMPEEDWDLVLDINLKGAFLCTKFAVKQMININSASSISPQLREGTAIGDRPTIPHQGRPDN